MLNSGVEVSHGAGAPIADVPLDGGELLLLLGGLVAKINPEAADQDIMRLDGENAPRHPLTKREN